VIVDIRFINQIGLMDHTMEMDELLDFIDRQDKVLDEHYGKGKSMDKDKMILARTVKLTEEVGELCNAVLAHFSFQRRSKLEKCKEDGVEQELADVIITVLLVAKSMDIDVKKALRMKIEKIKQRIY